MDVQTITVVIAGISVIIGVINSILSSRRNEEQRNVQLFMELYDTFHSKERYRKFYTAAFKLDFYKDVKADGEYGPNTNIDLLSDFASLMAYYEGIGVMVQKGWIDYEHIEDLGLSNSLIMLWERYRDGIQEDRKTYGASIWANVESLYHEMKHRQRLTARPETS
jgi:hypothetical protein